MGGSKLRTRNLGGVFEWIRRRPRFPQPPIVTVALAVFIYVTGFLLAAYFIGGGARFFGEGKAIDAMSTVFLSMASAFAWACLFLDSGDRWFGRLLWLCFGVGLLFLALDEQLEIHERLGRALKDPLGESSTFRNWNDVLVIMYGVVALSVAGMFLSEIVRYPRLLLLLGIGFLFYVAHTALDSLLEASGTKNVMEESCKLYSTAFFMLATLAALRSIVLSREESARKGVSPPASPSNFEDGGEARQRRATSKMRRGPAEMISEPPPAA